MDYSENHDEERVSLAEKVKDHIVFGHRGWKIMVKHTFGAKILKDYEIGESLGCGSFAFVFSAVQKSLGRKVALKVLKSERLKTDEHFLRFKREAELLSKISHPNIVKIFDYGLDEGRPYLVQELVEGCTLEEKIKEHGALSLQESIEIALSICVALKECHSASIIHRDLKPANVICCPDGTIKLLDFGLAAAYSSEDTRVTEEGAMLGTPMFMSPEQFNGQEATEKSDYYALGVIFYQMLTGKYPFSTGLDSLVAVKSGKRAQDLSALAELGHISKTTRFVESLLQRDPDLRLQTIAEIEAYLGRIQCNANVPTVVTAPLPVQALPAQEEKSVGPRKLPFVLLLVFLSFAFVQYIHVTLGRQKPLTKAKAAPLTLGRLSIDEERATSIRIFCATNREASLRAQVFRHNQSSELLKTIVSQSTRNHELHLFPLPANERFSIVLSARDETGQRAERKVFAKTKEPQKRYIWGSVGTTFARQDGTEKFSKSYSMYQRIHGLAGLSQELLVFNVEGRGLVCLNLQSRKTKWESDEITGARFLVFSKDNVFVANRAGHVASMRKSDGKLIWDIKLPGTFHERAFLMDDLLLLAADDHGLCAIDSISGKVRYHYQGSVSKFDYGPIDEGFIFRFRSRKAELLAPKTGARRFIPIWSNQ